MPFETESATPGVDGVPAPAAPDQGTPTVLDGGASSNPVESPSGGSTADEFAEFASALDGDPRKEQFLERLRGTAAKRDEYQSQLSQFEAYQPWLDAVGQLQQLGLTPEQFAEALQADPGSLTTTPETPAQAVDPEDAFADWVLEQTNGAVDPRYSDIDPALHVALRNQYDLQQWRQGLQQQEQARQEAEQRRQFQDELRQVQEAHPVLRQPGFAEALQGLWVQTGQPLPQVAQQLTQAIQAHTQAEVARYAQGKAQDGTVPVAAGGASPPPTAPPADFHRMSDDAQRAYVEDYLRTLTVQP